MKSAEVRLFDLRVGLEVGFLVERLAILDQLAEHDKTLVRVLVVGAIFIGTGREGDTTNQNAELWTQIQWVYLKDTHIPRT